MTRFAIPKVEQFGGVSTGKVGKFIGFSPLRKIEGDHSPVIPVYPATKLLLSHIELGLRKRIF